MALVFLIRNFAFRARRPFSYQTSVELCDWQVQMPRDPNLYHSFLRSSCPKCNAELRLFRNTLEFHQLLWNPEKNFRNFHSQEMHFVLHRNEDFLIPSQIFLSCSPACVRSSEYIEWSRGLFRESRCNHRRRRGRASIRTAAVYYA